MTTKTDTVWTKKITPPHFPTLEGDKKPDVLIIGGCIAGVLCAFCLQEAGVDYLLVEGKQIGQGITKGTTAKEVLAWANQDYVSLDGLPYIGAYSSARPALYTATSFNLWGMATSMVAARLLTNLVLGKAIRFAPVFDTRRSMLTRQLFIHLGTALLSFLTPTSPRCPHLGCTLKWNTAEQSWVCPCHGSRFDAAGHLIVGPATKDCHGE